MHGAKCSICQLLAAIIWINRVWWFGKYDKHKVTYKTFTSLHNTFRHSDTPQNASQIVFDRLFVKVTRYETVTSRSSTDHNHVVYEEEMEVPVPFWMDLSQELDFSGDLRKSPRCQVLVMHDDVMKWTHFPHYWPFVRGIHRQPLGSLNTE